MNRIVFVGNSDSIMKNISKDLSREFDVKICPAEIDSIREVFEVQRPELVVVSTSGFEMDHGAVYALLRDEYSHLPVLSVGTKAELKMFADYTQSEQFRELQRPVPSSCNCLHMVLLVNGLKYSVHFLKCWLH